MCILTEVPNRPAAFIEGHLSQIMNNTKQYAVQCGAESRTVRRGQIRLLRPPWWDELSDMTSTGLSTTSGVSAALATSTPIKYQVAAADANTIRSIVNNSASSAKSQHQLHLIPHHLSANNDLTTTASPSASQSASMCIGSNKTLPQGNNSRMPYGISKFESISMAHTSMSSVIRGLLCKHFNC